jgi:glycosyltransferase involved in cell wall biosynthesis
MFAKKFNIPIIMHWHFGRIPQLAIQKNWEWHLISYIIRKSAYSVVIDDHSYKALIEAGFKNVANIANPVSDELAKIALKQKNHERHIEEGKVVFVGHVFLNKGIYELVEACVDSKVVKLLKIIGPVTDEVKAELETISRRREDKTWLILTGAKSSMDVLSEISSAELLVLPSYTEGFPNVILEAMAMACPVVATNVGAIPEMLNINGDSPSGLCVPVKDIQSLKASIEKLLCHKDMATKLGQNGLNRVLDNFTLDKIFKEYQFVWQTAADSRKNRKEN